MRLEKDFFFERLAREYLYYEWTKLTFYIESKYAFLYASKIFNTILWLFKEIFWFYIININIKLEAKMQSKEKNKK